jgi:hypothetical protein
MARYAVRDQLYHRTLWVSSDRTGAEVQLPIPNPTPRNTRHYPYLVSWQQKNMVFLSEFEILISSQTTK